MMIKKYLCSTLPFESRPITNYRALGNFISCVRAWHTKNTNFHTFSDTKKVKLKTLPQRVDILLLHWCFTAQPASSFQRHQNAMVFRRRGPAITFHRHCPLACPLLTITSWCSDHSAPVRSPSNVRNELWAFFALLCTLPVTSPPTNQ